ncbi:MAG: radical SAM protein [Acidobacteria bacterium]|nr:radical SAM protein [Acidobacteriota bacterium]
MHEGCDCRCVMCDIWKIREPEGIRIRDLERQLDRFEELGVRWVVLTGGEAHGHTHFEEFTSALKARRIRVTLLTAGLVGEREAQKISAAVDDVIVSLDGPPRIHDSIRRVPRAFERLESGIRLLRSMRPAFPVQARCTVQRANHGALTSTIECARTLELDSISFLPADVGSTAFNRPEPWSRPRQNGVGLGETQVEALELEIERVIQNYHCGGFVVETPEKLRRIALYFRAHLGQAAPVSPRCNAPWVSAFIEARGDVRPCFFHPPIGNISQTSFDQIINGAEALRFRSTLDIPTNRTCQRCVCSLYLAPANEADSGSKQAGTIASPGDGGSSLEVDASPPNYSKYSKDDL